MVRGKAVGTVEATYPYRPRDSARSFGASKLKHTLFKTLHIFTLIIDGTGVEHQKVAEKGLDLDAQAIT